MKIDNTRFSQPTRHHWRGASRDLLLLALSISKKGKEDFPFLEIPLLSNRARDRTRTYTSQNTRS